MIPFPGESIGCYDAWSSVGGDPLWYDITFRGGATIGGVEKPGHRVINSGEQWRANAYNLDPSYLEAADDGMSLAVSWVVEVLGGSGTLVLSDEHDADFDYLTLPLPLANSLGTLTISGAGTYLMPTSSFTNAVLRELGDTEGAAQVRIQCTSGSIDVQQVKLRVWPASGVRGGWSDEPYTQPAYEMQPQTWAQSVGDPDPPEYWYATLEEYQAARVTFETSAVTSSFGSSIWQSVGYIGENETPAFTGGWGVAYYRTGSGEYLGPGVDGVDWIRPPTEVQYETDTSLYFQTTGPGGLEWTQGVVEARRGASRFILTDPIEYFYGDGSFKVSHAIVEDFFPGPGAIAFPLIGAGDTIAETPAGGDQLAVNFYDLISLPDPAPDDGLHRLVFWHTGHNGGVVSNGGATWTPYRGRTYEDTTFAPLRYAWQPDPYHWWDPSILAVRPLRQFHRDDGLGVTPPRAFGGASRIRTGRAFGYD
jgi:hypothetical protein